MPSGCLHYLSTHLEPRVRFVLGDGHGCPPSVDVSDEGFAPRISLCESDEGCTSCCSVMTVLGGNGWGPTLGASGVLLQGFLLCC